MSSVLKKIFQEIVLGIVIAGALLLGVILFSNIIVWSYSRHGMMSVGDAPKVKVVMVLGASVLRSGEPSDVLADRLLTALQIYETGKAEKFLLSGDNGSRDYDEVNAMKAYLLRRGVPAEDIFLDHAGFDTYDSLYRAKTIFGLRELIIVTQEFHLPRVVYLGRSLGLTVYGVPADRQEYRKIETFRTRELFANVKAVFDIVAGSQPTYLGQPISVDGDGQVTWD